MTQYDADFFELETEVATRSAEVVLPVILEMTNAQTVIDIGAGTGGWAYVAQSLGCEVLAVDHQVPEELQLLEEWIDHDLTAGYNCWEWDLAICLEVAEHLDETVGPKLVRGLSKATSVLFSAATPGQPGVGHVNCQPHDYWHALFAQHGLLPIHVGSLFDEPVADFYRRNMFLYRREQ